MEDFDNAKTRNPRECVVTNLNSYLTYISDIKETIKKEEGAEVSTKHYFFRGQASNEWNVMPGVFRGGMLPHEAELINAAYTRNPDDFRKLTTDFEKLAKLQHYGLPTRLLDVTENPLVALYFACQNNQERKTNDGKITLLPPTDGKIYYKRDYGKSYSDIEIKVLAYLASHEISGDYTLEKLLSDLNKYGIYTDKEAEECRASEYKSLLSIIQRNYFVISNLNNERLVRQSGSFLICGKYNVQLKGKIGQSIVKRAYSDVQDEFELQSFRIPAGRKSAILEELSFYNINEGTLFPELEHQMAYIKSNYANIQKPMADRFVKIEVPVTNIREVCDLDISDDKVDEIIQRVLRDEINPAFFDESYIAIQENLMPDWYRKEIGLSKVRLALTDTLDNGTPIGRAMAKRAAQSIVEKIANHEKQLRQFYSIKSKLMEEIDSLDPDDRHYFKRKADLDDRLYRMYDKIEDEESQMIEARAKRQAIEAEKLTGDNIYKVLMCFDKLYSAMNDVERRRVMEALISEIQIHEDRQPNGQWLKSIRFRLPIIEEDMNLSLDNNEHVETVCLLSKKP